MDKINIGCGDVPTRGWHNYDNSPSVRLAGWPCLTRLLYRLGLLSFKQRNFISTVRREGIRYANAVSSIPHANGSVAVIYTCHMLEHLDRQDARSFLREVRRVLMPGGIIRIAVPDLRYHIDQYLRDGDADLFMENLFTTSSKQAGIFTKLRYLLIGDRHHLWMYDARSLCQMLVGEGFRDPRVLGAGETTIPDPGSLDLAERSPESLFVEAVNP